jgi:hypothetical protein
VSLRAAVLLHFLQHAACFKIGGNRDDYVQIGGNGSHALLMVPDGA